MYRNSLYLLLCQIFDMFLLFWTTKDHFNNEIMVILCLYGIWNVYIVLRKLLQIFQLKLIEKKN